MSQLFLKGTYLKQFFKQMCWSRVSPGSIPRWQALGIVAAVVGQSAADPSQADLKILIIWDSSSPLLNSS